MVEAISQSSHGEGVFTRCGGEEFSILLSGTSSNKAHRNAESIIGTRLLVIALILAVMLIGTDYSVWTDTLKIKIQLFYAFTAQRSFADRARLLSLHSSAVGSIGPVDISRYTPKR